MVRRERGGAAAATKRGDSKEDSFDVWGGSRAFATHPLWSALPTDDPERPLYVNWYTGQTTSVRFPPPRDVRGGVLADEMGLGKTVELLMCVLANKYVPEKEKNERDADDDGGEDFVQGEDSKLDGDVVVQGEDSKLDGDVVVQGEDSKLDGDVAVKRSRRGFEKTRRRGETRGVSRGGGGGGEGFEGFEG